MVSAFPPGILLLVGLNLPTVKAFGETEFWFSLVKIVAILALIVCGLAMVVTGFSSSDGDTASFVHLWAHGGMFPTGFMGFVAGFQIAVFAFVGIELVGTAAAETKDLKRICPRPSTQFHFALFLLHVRRFDSLDGCNALVQVHC